MADLHAVVALLDTELRTADIADYPPALNGLQLGNAGSVHRIAAAVDGSLRAIDATIAAGADLLILHHGLFWGGNQRVVGPVYTRLKRLMDAGVAVYANHLPLDAHPTLGNNAQLAAALGLTVRGGFHHYQRTMVGTQGESDLLTSDLVARVAQFSAQHATAVIATPFEPERRTRRWAICTGAGASSDTLREAAALGIDTLITGEGPHHTAVEAPELGLVVVYAGHYATETLGVRAIAALAGDTFGLPWSFIAAPTGT